MNKERLLKIIIKPHISEKATIIAEKSNQYIFNVIKEANKLEIKEAVELIFNARVKEVCIANMPAKNKTFKGRAGKRKAWKKAYVTLYSDQKLDIISV